MLFYSISVPPGSITPGGRSRSVSEEQFERTVARWCGCLIKRCVFSLWQIELDRNGLIVRSGVGCAEREVDAYVILGAQVLDRDWRQCKLATRALRVTILAMCGRFTQNLSWAEIHRLAGLIGQPRNLAPRYNIAPTTPIEVIRASDAGNELVPMYWGLVPSWWKKPIKELPATFNARAETLAERPMFRGAFKYRRCIIPASGFYEWTGAKGAKTPHYFTSRDGRPLALAGIWDHWSGLDGGDDLPNATIIVGEANRWMRSFHDRMPVILDWRDAGAWMTGESPGALLQPVPEDALREWIVSKRVKKAGAGDDDPALIEPIEHA